MWLGLTIFISALYGVCMMIYIFGDLRQLRSFELSRPGISQPKPAPPLKEAHTTTTSQRPRARPFSSFPPTLRAVNGSARPAMSATARTKPGARPTRRCAARSALPREQYRRARGACPRAQLS